MIKNVTMKSLFLEIGEEKCEKKHNKKITGRTGRTKDEKSHEQSNC